MTSTVLARLIDSKPEIIRTDTLKDAMPSCVAVRKNGDIIVGDAALAIHKASAIRKFHEVEANCFTEFKRTMGTSVRYHSRYLNRELLPEDLTAEVLKKLRRLIADGSNFDEAVITHPAWFGIAACEATLRAAELAGFRRIRLLPEPVAVATAYNAVTPCPDGYLLVFNLGESVFETALVRNDGGYMFVKDFDYDMSLGGKNIDVAICKQIIFPYLQRNYTFINETEKFDAMERNILRLAEEVKIKLSTEARYNILSDMNDFPVQDEYGNDIEIDMIIDTEDLKCANAPVFQRAISIANHLLHRNNLVGGQLSAILLSGASTRSFILRRMLKEQIADRVNTSIDPQTAIAVGAALHAALHAASISWD
jgi:molecular chaperone DnaK